jgi:hypothetical protein
MPSTSNSRNEYVSHPLIFSLKPPGPVVSGVATVASCAHTLCGCTLTFLFQADDELEKPYLAGFEWDPEECYTRFVVHQANQPTSAMSGGGGAGGKKKKNKNAIPEEGS